MELIVGLDAALVAETREISAVAVAAVAAAGGADAFHATFRLEKAGGIVESQLAAIREAADRPVLVETLPTVASIRPVLSLRPDGIVLGPDRRGDSNAVLDPTLSASGLDAALRDARAAGIPVWLRVAAQLGPVRTAHRLGAKGVVFPASCLDASGDRAASSEAAEEAMRAAVKLHLKVVVGPLDELKGVSAVHRLSAEAGVLLGPSLLERAALLGLPAALRLARDRSSG